MIDIIMIMFTIDIVMIMFNMNIMVIIMITINVFISMIF